MWVGIIITAIQQLSGINTVSMYAPVIFDAQEDFEFLLPLMALVQVIFALITPLFINRIGRITVFMCGAVISSIAHLLSTIGYTEDQEPDAFNWPLNIGIILYGGVFNATYGVAT